MISLTSEEATNLNKVFGIISLHTQSDEVPTFNLDDRDGLMVIFKLNNFEDSIGDELEEEGFESVVEDDYLIIEI